VVPVLFMEGVSGAFFRPLAVSYVLAVLASLVVALTVTPALALMLLGNGAVQASEGPLVRTVQRGYDAFLARTIRAPLAALVTGVERVVDGYPGLSGNVQTYLRDRMREVLTGADDAIVVRLYGPERATLQRTAEDVKQALSKINGIAALKVEGQAEEAQIEVRVDLAAAERYGLKPGDIRRQVATVFAGLQVGTLFEQQKVFEVVVWGAPEVRSSLTSLRELLLETPKGKPVRLREVAPGRARRLDAADGAGRWRSRRVRRWRHLARVPRGIPGAPRHRGAQRNLARQSLPGDPGARGRSLRCAARRAWDPRTAGADPHDGGHDRGRPAARRIPRRHRGSRDRAPDGSGDPRGPRHVDVAHPGRAPRAVSEVRSDGASSHRRRDSPCRGVSAAGVNDTNACERDKEEAMQRSHRRWAVILIVAGLGGSACTHKTEMPAQ